MLTSCCAGLDVNLVIAGAVMTEESNAAGELRDEVGIESPGDLIATSDILYTPGYCPRFSPKP